MSASGFNVGKFLGLTAALAVGAGAGAGAYYGVRVSSSDPNDADPNDEDPNVAADADAEPAEVQPKLDVPGGSKLDIPAVDEPSDPGHLRLDVPAPWGADVKGGGGGGGGGGVTQETG